MAFGNPILGGTSLIRSAIRSSDYVTGVSGWTINKDGTAEFNDATFRGTITASTIETATSGRRITINEDDNQSITLYNSLDDVMMTLGDEAGTITSYNQSDGTVSLDMGGAALTFNYAGGSILTPVAWIDNDSTGIRVNTFLAGGIAFDAVHAAWVSLVAGSNTRQTWQVVGTSPAPAYASATFAAASTAGNYQPLQFRYDAEDNLHIEGTFHCTAAVTTSGQVFSLPVGYRPKVARQVDVVSDLSTGVLATGSYSLQLNSNGPVNLHTSATTAVGQNFYVNVVIPRGNIA